MFAQRAMFVFADFQRKKDWVIVLPCFCFWIVWGSCEVIRGWCPGGSEGGGAQEVRGLGEEGATFLVGNWQQSPVSLCISLSVF